MDILSVIGRVLTIVSFLLLVPVAVLVLQIMASLRPVRAAPPAGPVRPRLAVLMPAHNESAGIAAALATVVPQLGDGDRVLVVADNCTDDTAGVAAAAGAEVIMRKDSVRRGKGYALDFGVRHLAADPPEVLVVVDADCNVGRGALDRLARRCRESARPVQALYLMRSPPQAGLKTRIAEFAWTVRNHARPLGCARLGLPCQLMGTGMAFPWALISNAPLASGHLVEDLQLGLDLASAGAAPLFCPEALVTSSFPSETEGLAAQRTRWEHGHLSVIASVAPRLVWRAVSRGQAALAAMALDLCVPPLASLVLMHLAWLAVCGVLAAFGAGAMALVVAVCSLLLLSGGVMLAWWRYARHIVSLTELLGAPAYVVSKIPVYAKLFGKRQMEWVRTKRDDKSN